ncbi:MAG: flagellar type III secretion system protein FliQ [Clostridiales Family XIII bacterium]|jgi:flagellar biosynthetic protein FliQ|nr:flagellar type III secretion system protein FliQ [Clostridiales Family XIII bacterium]
MTTLQLQEILQDAIMTGFVVGGPILGLSILVGLIIAVFQAATSINEQTLTFVPKIIVIALVLIIFGNFMMQKLVDLTLRLFEVMAVMTG